MTKIKLHNYTKTPSCVQKAYLTIMNIDALRNHVNSKLNQYFPDWQIGKNENPVQLIVVKN
jgi:hypothetical protein